MQLLLLKLFFAQSLLKLQALGDPEFRYRTHESTRLSTARLHLSVFLDSCLFSNDFNTTFFFCSLVPKWFHPFRCIKVCVLRDSLISSAFHFTILISDKGRKL